jgi:hypothetical protein
MGKNKFGYIGPNPTQSAASNSGIFSVNNVGDLKDQLKYPGAVAVQYLVIAGAGGGATSWSSDNRGGGGGGAGGYRSSHSGDTFSGGNSSIESPFNAEKTTAYTVTVGGGGSGGSGSYFNDGTKGSDSALATVTSLGGGASGDAPNIHDGGSGAGQAYSEGAGAGTIGQGSNGGTRPSNGGTPGGCGGGAGGVGPNSSGTNSTTINPTNYLASSITGTSVNRARGGGTSSGSSGGANTGNGGYGKNNNGSAGSGGSGIVIIKWITSTASCTVGAGLTASQTTDGDYSIITFTAGTGTISFS